MNQLIRPETGEILSSQAPADLAMLDVYSPGPVAAEAPRLDWMATCSAGFRQLRADGSPGAPQVSRDGTIYLSDPNGRAPRLKEVLAARGNKSLTIAFPFDNPAAFVQQHFTMYSASKLLVYGDEDHLIMLDERTGDRRVLLADTPEYHAERARCKVSISIYFALADWRADGTPVVEFPDGLGLYRIRTTSRNTLRSLRASLHHVGAFTGGRIAGVPFETALEYRDVAGPDGARHSVPVWTFTMKPPATLSSRTFVPTLTAALAEGRRLQLPPPTAEGLADAEWDFDMLGDDDTPVVQPSEADVALLAQGGRCDARAYEQRWFAIVRRTYLDSDEARADFLRRDTHGRYASLARFLAEATEHQAQAFIMRVAQDVDRWRQEQRAVFTEPLAEAGATLSGRPPLDLTGVGDDDRAGVIPTVEPFFSRPMESGDIVDLDPPELEEAPGVPGDPQITSTRDPAWQSWLQLVRDAAAAGVPVDDVPLLPPPTHGELRLSELRGHYGRLQQQLKEKVGDSAPR